MIITIGALLLMASGIATPYSPYSVTLSMMIFSTGAAICQAVVFNASMNVFPEIKGTASSAVSGIRSFMMAIFIGLTSYVYNGQVISVSFLVLFMV